VRDGCNKAFKEEKWELTIRLLSELMEICCDAQSMMSKKIRCYCNLRKYQAALDYTEMMLRRNEINMSYFTELQMWRAKILAYRGFDWASNQ
jgi:pentatricopeptide repeat protein